MAFRTCNNKGFQIRMVSCYDTGCYQDLLPKSKHHNERLCDQLLSGRVYNEILNGGSPCDLPKCI